MALRLAEAINKEETMRFRLPIVGASTFVTSVLMGIVPAGAVTTDIRIKRTGGQGVNIRPEPNTFKAPIGVIGEGKRPTYVCYTRGQSVGGINVWFKVRYRGKIGFYSAHYDTTTQRGLMAPKRNYGIAQCTKAQLPHSLPFPTKGRIEGRQPYGDVPVHKVRYNRSAAANWALAHARDFQPPFSGCAWFVSNALHAGGLPQTSQWNFRGSHGRTGITPGTESATSAVQLIRYLKRTYRYHWIHLEGEDEFKVNRVPEARVGDIIAYDWQGDEGIDHVAFIVAIASGQYPEVAEWGTVKFGRAPYAKRGWTWSELANEGRGGWLQKEKPGVKAHLLRLEIPRS